MDQKSNRADLPIYLDYQATTPCDPRIVEAMIPFFSNTFGNPHSFDHRHGWDAEEAVEASRRQVAKLIRAKVRDIVFTSGATESNNLAIKGAARWRRREEGRNRVITLATEHKCVLESAARLEREGFDVTILPVHPNGLIDLDKLDDALDARVAIVSVMAANNEIGTLQPLSEIADRVHRVGGWFHSDAAQAFGKVPLHVDSMGIDLMSISGHKIYGPKGIGALFVRGRNPKVSLEPLMDGGGQERGLRSGTLAPALCVGLGVAADLASREMEAEAERVAELRDTLWHRLKSVRPDLSLNGDLEHRLPGNLNVTVPGIESSELLAALDGLSVSGGSACSSGAQSGSHVLQALGHDPGIVAAGLRIGLGRFTTPAEIDQAAALLTETLSVQTSLKISS